MQKTDVNCLLGHWPFRKIRKNTFEGLQNIHRETGITCGYLSSLNSIFYNDPFEGDEELHEIIKDTGYKHILTVNPSLPGYEEDIEKGLKLFDIKGVRIYPGYHGYSLEDKNLVNLCRILLEADIPLFLSMRMEDERLDYLLQPRAPSVEDISHFLTAYPDNRILLMTIRYGELIAIKDILNETSKIFFDTSGLKDALFTVEKLVEAIGSDKMVYGSLYPLFCLKSTLLLVEKAAVEEKVKSCIFSENVRRAVEHTTSSQTGQK